MSVIYIVLPLALLIAIVAVIAYIWAVRSGQYDDLDTPAMQVLHEDDDETAGAGPWSRPGGDDCDKR